MRRKTQHPDEDYFRLGLSINEDIPFSEKMKIIREEKALLLEFEIEETDNN